MGEFQSWEVYSFLESCFQELSNEPSNNAVRRFENLGQFMNGGLMIRVFILQCANFLELLTSMLLCLLQSVKVVRVDVRFLF